MGNAPASLWALGSAGTGRPLSSFRLPCQPRACFTLAEGVPEMQRQCSRRDEGTGSHGLEIAAQRPVWWALESQNLVGGTRIGALLSLSFSFCKMETAGRFSASSPSSHHIGEGETVAYL